MRQLSYKKFVKKDIKVFPGKHRSIFSQTVVNVFILPETCLKKMSRLFNGLRMHFTLPQVIKGPFVKARRVKSGFCITSVIAQKIFHAYLPAKISLINLILNATSYILQKNNSSRFMYKKRILLGKPFVSLFHIFM